MHSTLENLAQGFPNLIYYLLVVTVIYITGLVTYVKLTPHKEIELVQHGNMAAAVSFSALIIGLALPLAACLVVKIGLLDVFLWGVVSVLLQLFLFRLTDMIFSNMSARIENNEIAPALVMSAFKLAGSIILAVAIAG